MPRQKVKRGPGRPPGSKNKPKKVEEPDVLVPKSLKPTEVRARLEKALKELERHENGMRCQICGAFKAREKFYGCGIPMVKTRMTCVCRECGTDIAMRKDQNGVRHEPTKESVILALKMLNKPFIESVWDAAKVQMQNPSSGQQDTNMWTTYMHLISMPQYYDKDFMESDLFRSTEDGYQLRDPLSSDEIKDSFIKNKEDTIRLLGYDPFINELPEDQPFMYANLIGYIDASGEANDDRLRLAATIEIVKSFNQIEKMNDTLSFMLRDTNNLDKHMANIKNLEMTKSTMTQSINKLAAENGISIKNSVNSTKGENTWTGKLRMLKEMNLREQEVNLYDAEYSAALRQVADISNASLLKQLSLDENDYTEIIGDQRKLLTEYKERVDTAEEKVRILTRENQDLKKELKERGVEV